MVNFNRQDNFDGRERLKSGEQAIPANDARSSRLSRRAYAPTAENLSGMPLLALRRPSLFQIRHCFV